MASNSCVLYPLANGEPSKLYKDLLKLTGNRPKANYIYAVYLQSGVAAQMDSKGYSRDKLGEHKIGDVERFLDVMTYIRESTDSKVSETARNIGAIDFKGNPIDYTNAEDALKIAQQHNSNSKGTVASVYAKGDKFNIVVDTKNSRTQLRGDLVEKQLQQWDVLKHSLNSIGIDVSTADLDKSVYNATNAKEAVQQMKNIQMTDNKYLSKNEIKDLLVFNENSTQVQRLQQLFGSLDDVAQKIYDSYRVGGVTATQKSLIDATLDNCKRYKNLDIQSLTDQINNIEQSFQNTEESNIADTLKTLNKKYNLDFNEILLTGNNIRSLSQAASEAAVTLQRQLKELKAKQGITQETKNIETALNTLMKEINSNKYYIGVLGFLDVASKQIQNMETMLKNIPQSGNNLARAANTARILMQIKSIKEGYSNILRALSNIDTIITDEKLNDSEKQNIKDQASKLIDFFDKYDKVITDLRLDTMTTIATEFLGDKLSNGTAVVNLVDMAEKDSSIYDKLYSVARVSNPLIATMGNIIRDAQSSRDTKMNAISLRIRRAENKLRKSGSTSEFMYEPNGYIISDIDWSSYIRARRKVKDRLYFKGYKGLSLEEALRAWEEANTEDRVVDNVSGRTERVPNSNYRKVFPQLTQAQQEYYTEMMQIKGELGTLLPNYAKRHYSPPQIRRSFIDAVNAAVKKGSLHDFIKAFITKAKDFTTIREDDTQYARNGIINGEEYGVLSGAMDNTPFRQIPIFYLNKLKDQDELYKNFSSALQHLAGTAINYEAMEGIKDTVEFMADFLREQEVSAERGNTKSVDLIEDTGIRVFKQLKDFASNSNTIALLDGFIEKHIYGVQLKDSGKFHLLLRNLLNYTSLRSLAVNAKGAISNYVVGELQMIIEAGGLEFFNPVDYLWAHKKIFGDNTINAIGRIMDFVTNDVNSRAVLLGQLFDPLNENFSEQQHERYHRGFFRSLLGKDFSFIGYGMGEHMIHYVTMYSILHNTKVKVNGKEKTLYDIFSIGNKKDGNSELIMDKNATYTDENGNDVPIDNAFIEKIRKRIRYCNQTMHGAMNEEDKGIIHQHMLGRFVMNLRQWMVEHYSRRFRASHFDATLGEYREGFWNTTSKMIYGTIGDVLGFEREAMLHWKNMNTMQKANVRRAMTEFAVLCSLLTLSFALGEPDEHKKEFWMRMWIYQTKRAITDINGSTPWGIPMEMNTLINNPIAASNVVNSLLYPIMGLGDITETISRGKHKDENKYLRNIKKYSLPFYGQIEQLREMDEDNGVFKVFDKSNLQK